MRSSVCFNVLTCATPYKQRSLQTVARLPSDKAPRTGEGTRQGGMDAGRGRESERQGGLGVAGVWPVMGGGAVGDHRGNVGNEPEKIIAKEMSLRNVWPQRGGRRGGGGGSGREWNHISLRRIFILSSLGFFKPTSSTTGFPWQTATDGNISSSSSIEQTRCTGITFLSDLLLLFPLPTPTFCPYIQKREGGRSECITPCLVFSQCNLPPLFAEGIWWRAELHDHLVTLSAGGVISRPLFYFLYQRPRHKGACRSARRKI